MTVRSFGTQEMEEGFECLEEQNCDTIPPPRGPPPLISSQSQRTKESQRKGASLEQVLEEY